MNKINKNRTVPSTIRRVEKKSNYTVMSNYHLRSENLSLKAVGLLSKILSLPDDWVFTISGLVAICKEKETAVKSALRELKEWGYLEVTKMNSDETNSGRFEYVYTFFEYSEKDKPAHLDRTNISEEIPPAEFLPVENQRVINTDNKINKNNISFTQESVHHTDIFCKSKNERLTDSCCQDKEKIREIVKANIGYEEYMEWIRLFPNLNFTSAEVTEFVETIVREICSVRNYEWICNERVPMEEVRQAMLKADRYCLENAITRMYECEDEIRNKQKYFISTLYNEVNCKEFSRNYQDFGKICVC